MARLSLVSPTPPQEPPAPALTGKLVAIPDPVRKAWSPLEDTFHRLRLTCADRNTTDTKLAEAPALLDALIARAQALRGMM